MSDEKKKKKAPAKAKKTPAKKKKSTPVRPTPVEAVCRRTGVLMGFTPVLVVDCEDGE